MTDELRIAIQKKEKKHLHGKITYRRDIGCKTVGSKELSTESFLLLMSGQQGQEGQPQKQAKKNTCVKKEKHIITNAARFLSSHWT